MYDYSDGTSGVTDGNDNVLVDWNSKVSGAEANFVDKYF
jgi:hypothetical protein